MGRAQEFLRHWSTQVALVGVIVVLAATGVFRESTRASQPQLTAENVARFYAAGETGLEIHIVKSEEISTELGAEEAYRFTITAKGFEGEAQIVVAKSQEGGWIVVPQQQTPSSQG